MGERAGDSAVFRIKGSFGHPALTGVCVESDLGWEGGQCGKFKSHCVPCLAQEITCCRDCNSDSSF